MKKFRFCLFLLFLTAVCLLISACGSSYGRTGYGPYDYTDYGDLDARMDMMDFGMDRSIEDDIYPEPEIDWIEIYGPPIDK